MAEINETYILIYEKLNREMHGFFKYPGIHPVTMPSNPTSNHTFQTLILVSYMRKCMNLLAL